MGNRVLNIFKKFPIHPSFFLLFLYLVVCNGIESFFIFVFVVLIHEFAHAWTAKRLGYKLDNFFLTPYGASLNYKEKTFDSKDEIYISLAGPLINIILGIAMASLWWIFPEIYNYTSTIVNQSFLFAIFNLLPCYPLDGGRIFLNLFSQNVDRKKIVKILIMFNIFFSAIFFILFIISCINDFNPTFVLAGIFMILGLVEGNTKSKYKLISSFTKKTKNFSKVRILFINQTTPLLKVIKKIDNGKFTLFAVDNGEKIIFLDEKKVLSLALVFPVTLPIEKVLDQIRNK